MRRTGAFSGVPADALHLIMGAENGCGWVRTAGAYSGVEPYNVCECVCWCVCAEKILQLVEECALFLLPCLGLCGEYSDVLSRVISLFQ